MYRRLNQELLEHPLMSDSLSLPNLSVSNKDIKLGKNEVHVWRASLDRASTEIQELMLYLSSDEKQRANRFRFLIDREYYITARGILRWILGRYLEKDPTQLIFKYNNFGKPFLTGQECGEDVSFNLSHSYDLVLYAFTRGRKVGIDVEYTQSEIVKDYIVEHTFSAREVEVLRNLPEDIQVQAFFNCWTRKEAYVKAKGQALSIPLNQFDVSLSPGDPVRLLNTKWDVDEISRWSLHELKVGSDYAASLAVEGNGLFIKYHEWYDKMHISYNKRDLL